MCNWLEFDCKRLETLCMPTFPLRNQSNAIRCTSFVQTFTHCINTMKGASLVLSLNASPNVLKTNSKAQWSKASMVSRWTVKQAKRLGVVYHSNCSRIEFRKKQVVPSTCVVQIIFNWFVSPQVRKERFPILDTLWRFSHQSLRSSKCTIHFSLPKMIAVSVQLIVDAVGISFPVRCYIRWRVSIYIFIFIQEFDNR